MAGASPRLPHKSTVMNIAVVGLTSSSQGDQGEGSGKSCLCNKFIIPHSGMFYNIKSAVCTVNDYMYMYMYNYSQLISEPDTGAS